MKSKISFFNGTALKKDITRFAPVWALYLVLGLLMLQGRDRSPFSRVESIGESLGWLGILQMVYAMLCAQLLFGDLFSSRMCYALHAMPPRREGWFCTHIAAGLLFFLIPNGILCLAMMPGLSSLWFTPLLWLLGAGLEFLFFFGLSVLCVMLTGNRFAAVSVYGLLNFLSVIGVWLARLLYQPLLYGVHIRARNFTLFSPVIELPNRNYFRIDWQISQLGRMAYWRGLDKDFWYLAVLAAVGVVTCCLALVLYRRRALESAGDFAAFRPVHYLFSTVGTACAGAAFYQLSGESYIFLLLGILAGFFCCQMLLQRKVRVFGRKSWLHLAALVAVVALSLLVVRLDPAGIVRRVPDTDRVASVSVARGHLSEYWLNTISPGDAGTYPHPNSAVTFANPDGIRRVQEIHRLLIEEGDASKNSSNYVPITVHYVLTNGQTLTRYYYCDAHGDAMALLRTMITLQ